MEQIVKAKISRGIAWADVAAELGVGEEWVTAACLGQMTSLASSGEDRLDLRTAGHGRSRPADSAHPRAGP
ncbi:hypothetical protein [Streptomyces sp. SCL15-6]|uniref:hypothetical protein n=1 Tax=Streptomyces sp. SCL15-6 TaxID=2967222 RepID=UPI00398FB287